MAAMSELIGPYATDVVLHQRTRSAIRAEIEKALTAEALLTLPLYVGRFDKWADTFIMTPALRTEIKRLRPGQLYSTFLPPAATLVGLGFDVTVAYTRHMFIVDPVQRLVRAACVRALGRAIVAALNEYSVRQGRNLWVRFGVRGLASLIPGVGLVVSGVAVVIDAWMLKEALNTIINFRARIADDLTREIVGPNDN